MPLQIISDVDEACEMEPDNLAILRQITDALPMPEISRRLGRGFEVETEAGTIYAFELVKNPYLSLLDTFASFDAIMNWHTHEELEVFFVHKGEMIVEFEGGKTVNLPAGHRPYYVLSGTPHRTSYIGNTKVYVICIPPLEMGGMINDR